MDYSRGEESQVEEVCIVKCLKTHLMCDMSDVFFVVAYFTLYLLLTYMYINFLISILHVLVLFVHSKWKRSRRLAARWWSLAVKSVRCTFTMPINIVSWSSGCWPSLTCGACASRLVHHHCHGWWACCCLLFCLFACRLWKIFCCDAFQLS